MAATSRRQKIFSGARRIVVKVGTGAVCRESGRLDGRSVTGLARQIAAAMRAGIDVTLVASGAIGAGLAEMDMPRRPRTMPMLQAVAAVGQGRLMRTFHDAFARHRVKVAQVLLTRDDFEDRKRYLNIRNTLAALSELDALTVINENDAVAVDEIRFGDNDIIAAHVTNMLAAEVLVLLSVVDGVVKNNHVLDVIERVDEGVLALAGGDRSTLGTGGMASKLTAAEMVTRAGEAAVIANARTPNVLTRLLAGETVGTLLVPAARKMSSRRRWIGLTSRPAGRLVVDDGAARALTHRGKSLLPSGVTGVLGRFEKGAIVAVIDPAGRQIARGLTNYPSAQIDKIKGLKTRQIAKAIGDKPYDEIIHRDNLTLG
jgi:glutamate 5-kinase